MNNRNQQTARVAAPAEAPAHTYLNVFTVEEYERDGKTQKRWTKIGQRSRIRTVSGSLSNSKPSRLMVG
jgi:hypothetical protein